MYICHDIYSDVIKRARVSKNLMKLREQADKSAEPKNIKLGSIDARLKAINEKINHLDHCNIDIWELKWKFTNLRS